MAEDTELLTLRKLNAQLIKKIACLRQQVDRAVPVIEGYDGGKSVENGIDFAEQGSAQVAEMPQEAPLTPPGPAEERVQAREPSPPATMNFFQHAHSAQPDTPDSCAGCSSCLLNSGLDNFRKRLSWVVDKLSSAAGGSGAWEHMRSMEAKLEAVIPSDGSVGRKELRQLKGARVQEMVGALQSIAKEIRACKQSLQDDGPVTMEGVRAELFETLLGVESLIDHRRQELKGLNEAGRQIRDLGFTLEAVEEERDAALLQRDALQARMEGLLSTAQESPSSAGGEENKVGATKRDLQLEKINRLERELVAAEGRMVRVQIHFADPEGRNDGSEHVGRLHGEIAQLKQRNLEVEEQLKGCEKAFSKLQAEMGFADKRHRLALAEKQEEVCKLEKRLLEIEYCSADLVPGLVTPPPESVADCGEDIVGQGTTVARALKDMDGQMCQCVLKSDPVGGELRQNEDSLGGGPGEKDLAHAQSYLSNALGALNSLAQEMRFLGGPPKEPSQSGENNCVGSSTPQLEKHRNGYLPDDQSAGAHCSLQPQGVEADEEKKGSIVSHASCSKGAGKLAHGQHLWWAIALGGSAMAVRLVFAAFQHR
eukprot:evm.model.scf_2161.2 EVM.evm.TU.scf_2161.2   scf_2161:16459-18243(+)